MRKMGGRGRGRTGGRTGGRFGGTQRPPRRDKEGEGPPRQRFFRKKICRFCTEKIGRMDYKDVERLGKFLTEKGKIIGRRITGNCAKHQRWLARAIKQARHAALVPFQAE